jgi:hypothetical protein
VASTVAKYLRVIYVCNVLGESDRTATAASLVVTSQPMDDAGASTADAYEWQAAMAAADGLGLYFAVLDDGGNALSLDDCRIICEYHEDWVLLQGNEAELVSAKHKEPSYGAYTTVNQLLGDGGLAHLFLRWHLMDEKPTCRLVTTAGLARGESQALDRTIEHLRKQRLAGESLSVDGDHGTVITDFTKKLIRRDEGLPPDWKTATLHDGSAPSPEQCAQVGRFLSMLTIQHSEISRAYVSHAAPSRYANPILDRLGYPTRPAEVVWQVAIALFRVRMRAAGPRLTGGLPPVMAYQPGTPLPGPEEIERSLAARIVTMSDMDIAIRTAIANPAGYLPLKPVLRTTRMAIKMETGQLMDNSIERAEHLRLDYRKHWRNRLSGNPTAMADQEQLLRELLRICDEATSAASNPGGAWGMRFWTEVQSRVAAICAAGRSDGMDGDLLLGGICELANRCRVWFSDGFDINAEIDRRRALRSVTS